MKVSEAYDLIKNLKIIKSCLQARYTDTQIVNNIELSRKIRKYNEEIERLNEAILKTEVEYEINKELYTVEDE